MIGSPKIGTPQLTVMAIWQATEGRAAGSETQGRYGGADGAITATVRALEGSNATRGRPARKGL